MRPTLFSMFQNSAGERVRIALALKGLDYEYVSVLELGWDAYAQVNPQRLVPALKLGDDIVAQATAILEYLEERHPSPALLPKDPLLRAQARGFAQHITSEMHALDVLRIRRFLHDRLGVEDDGLDTWRRHWFALGFEALEELLRRRPTAWPFCFGEQPGWADLHLVPQVRKGIDRVGADLRPYPLILGIHERCIEEPAFIAASSEAQPDYPGETT